MSESVLSQRKAQLSKLKNIREHLNALLSKKARIEIEIKDLKRSYKRKMQEYQKSEKEMKFKISLEGLQNFALQNGLSDFEVDQIKLLDGQIAQEAMAISEMLEKDQNIELTFQTFFDWLEEQKIPETIFEER